MDLTASVDLSRLQWQMTRLAQAVGPQFAGPILRNTAKQALRAIVSNRPQVSVPQTQIIGEYAVEGDFHRAAVPFDRRTAKKFFKGQEPKTLARILAAIDSQNVDVLLAMFKRMPAMRGWNEVSGVGMKAHMDSRRDGRGHIGHGKNQLKFFMLNTAAYFNNMARAKKAVGKELAGWYPAAAALGVPLPPFAQRHGMGYGYYSENFNSTSPFILMANHGSKRHEYPEKIARVVKFRSEALATQLRAVLMGNAVNLGFMKLGGASWWSKAEIGGVDRTAKEIVAAPVYSQSQ